jgi:uncharacterized protein (TIGR02001 family)
MASEFSGAATLTSQYIYRGMAASDGDPALQLGIDYEHDSGLFVGAWASTIELNSAAGERDLELDYYAGFHYSSDAPWTTTLTVLRYTYPGQTGAHSYDYNEVLLAASWQQSYTVEFGYTSDLYGLDLTARHWSLRAEWPFASAWVLGGAIGGNDLSNAGASHYLHWDLGASARISRLTFDLRWYDNERPKGPAAQQSAGSQLVLSISAAF